MVEDLEKFITDAYWRVLGRPPDPVGLSDYKRALSDNMQLSDLELNLRSSLEYLGLYKLVKDGKIRDAYIDSYDHIVWTKCMNTSKHSIEKDTEIVLVSTHGIKCGIATYTEYLSKNINKLYKSNCRNIVGVYSINGGITSDSIDGKLVHLQHEYGIMPRPPKSNSKVIVTFHTVLQQATISEIEKNLNVVAYVAHFKEAKDIISSHTQRDIWLIPHGSKIIPGVNMPQMKDYARKLLLFDDIGITDEPCAFMFGFQSGNKNYDMLAQACKNTGVKLIISGAIHQSGVNCDIGGTEKVIFLGKFLSETEVDLYALASDILLFQTIPLRHYSCSGALHRVVGAGRPVICSRVNHYSDIIEDENCLKYETQDELERKIMEALKKKEEFGRKAWEYAEKTSWETVAKKHLEMYRKYGDIE